MVIYNIITLLQTFTLINILLNYNNVILIKYKLSESRILMYDNLVSS